MELEGGAKMQLMDLFLGWGGPGHEWAGTGSWWPIFPILWFLLLAGVAVTIAVLWSRRARQVPAAEARLAERYASGDIGEQEYQERLAVLRRPRKRPR